MGRALGGNERATPRLPGEAATQVPGAHQQSASLGLQTCISTQCGLSVSQLQPWREASSSGLPGMRAWK